VTTNAPKHGKITFHSGNLFSLSSRGCYSVVVNSEYKKSQAKRRSSAYSRAHVKSQRLSVRKRC